MKRCVGLRFRCCPAVTYELLAKTSQRGRIDTLHARSSIRPSVNTPPTTIRATRTPRASAGESAQHPDAILSKERGRTRQIEASSTPANVSRIHPWSAAARTCSTQPSVCAAIRRNERRSFTESRRRDVSRRSHRVDGIIYRAGVATISCCTWRARRRVGATRGGPSLAARRERGFAALRFV